MPSDTFTLQIFDTGISIPALHASTHDTDGSDPIPVATSENAGLMSASQAADVAFNNSKVTNATHTGDVTGSTALTIANDAVTTAKIAATAVTEAKIASDAVTTNKIKDANVTLAKIQDVAQYTVLGRDAAGTGLVTTKSCTALGFDLISGADAAAMRSTLELGALATQDTVSVSSGGTGQTSYVVGDIIYASGTTSLSKLASVATGNALISGGVANAPSYGKIGLTTHVSGILPIANGGTNSATGVDVSTSLVTGILPIAKGGTANDGSAVSAITFDTLKFKTVSPSSGDLSEGQLRWNSSDKTLDLKMAGLNVTQQVGQELLMRVHSPTAITNGDVVYISGANSGLPSIAKASSNDVESKKTIAMATEDISSGSDGYVTLYGLVRGLDLSSFVAGQELWLGETAGSITGTEPVYPNHKVRVGFVIIPENGTGSAYVSPKFYENGLVNGTGKIGYLTGSGGSVTQLTSKATTVVLSETNGQITMVNSSLAGGDLATFTLTNTKIESGDVLILNHFSGGTLGNYSLNARSASGSATITVRNVTNSALSDAIVIAFVVIKAVTS